MKMIVICAIIKVLKSLEKQSGLTELQEVLQGERDMLPAGVHDVVAVLIGEITLWGDVVAVWVTNKEVHSWMVTG
jgi:hypothetical protein